MVNFILKYRYNLTMMKEEDEKTHLVIGGGAAGFFGALSCASQFPTHRVILLEKTGQLLSKVRISGGGRCNVTHACFDPALLVKNYPRGSLELRGPFTRFQPKNTIDWFESRKVQLKTEEDGRMFPVTDNSETIIHCLQQEAKRLNVEIHIQKGLSSITPLKKGFLLHLTNGEEIKGDTLLMATGSSSKIYPLLESLGHTIIPLVPSLFTFNIPESPFHSLAGVSISDAHVSLPEFDLEQRGPLLITHWGVSGPAVLKLSAWAARMLHAVDYQAELQINWLPTYKESDLRECLIQAKQALFNKLIGSESPLPLPKQLWKKIIEKSGLDAEERWARFSHKQLQLLIKELQATTLYIEGKTTYKQEFVTCGGISLDEVNFKTMESRRCPGLYFAGEILNIDGVTGGFNFQNAWTTGWIAGQSMGL